MLRIDHADRSRLRTHDETLRAGAVTPVTNAAQQLAVGEPGSREEHVVARHEIVEREHFADVVARIERSLAFIVVARPQPALNSATETLERARGDDTLRRTADAEQDVVA